MRGRAFGVVAGAIGFVVALAGAVFAGSVAYATTSILVDQGQGAGARPFSAQLTVDALASPTGRLYPGGRSDVVVTIANPNPYPVTVTAISLPADTAYATGFTTSAHTTVQDGCGAATPSEVVWSDSGASSGSSHTLARPITVAAKGQANNPLTVRFIAAAVMGQAAPAACEGAYLSMPAMTGVTVTEGPAKATVSPTTDGWTS